MSRVQLVWLLLATGALLCIPGAVVFFIFASTEADANAIKNAPICATAARAVSSSCLSLLNGRITSEHSGGKSLRRVTIALEDVTVDVGYGCFESPPDACAFPIQASSDVVTGWWRGQLVTIGAPGSRPAVVTDLNPEDGLRNMTFYLVAVIPGASLILAGLLLWQAPTTEDGLYREALARWPDPPRPVERHRVWRVAWGYDSYLAYPFWAAAYALGSFGFFTIYPQLSSLAPVFLVVITALVMGLAAMISAAILSNSVRMSQRRSLVVQRVEQLSKNGPTTRVYYQQPDGSVLATDLGAAWKGRVKEGDRLEVLTLGSGSVLRVLSTPA